MIASQTEPISFEDFLTWYPNNAGRYELIEGVIVEMLRTSQAPEFDSGVASSPTGSYEDVAGFLAAELNLAIRTSKLPYSISRNCLLKPPAPRSGYLPDVAVINREYIKDEPLWQKSSVIQLGQTVPLVIEVVSTNWRDDYGHKFVEYEAMGIAEYWIVDYRALGAVRYIGKPKQPTITICKLVEREYQMEKFVKGEFLKSDIFPELKLTIDKILEATI